MAKTTATVSLHNAKGLSEDTLLLGERIIKRWKIPAGPLLTLRFGALKQDIRVVAVARSSGIRLHGRLMSRLGLFPGAKVCLNYSARTKLLELGPLIGVLLTRSFTRYEDRPFGPNTAFCRELTEACNQNGGFIYFFTPKEIPDGGRTILGWTFNGNWRRSRLPFPDVLYNRLTSRVLENSPNVQQLFSDVKSAGGASIFNEKYLNKTEVFQTLQQVPELKAYLPETREFRNMQHLETMCDRHRTVFLKPILNSLGKGIVRITRAPKSGYICHNNNPVGIRETTFPNFAKMSVSLRSRMKSGLNQIQQGLRLIELQGRPVDFRVLVQRNKKGEWSATSTVGRAAGAQNFVSNIARGGTLVTVADAAAGSNLVRSHRAALGARLKEAALAIAQGLSDKLESHFAELGVDLAVEPSGKIWLLEVNSKPSKEDSASLNVEKIRPSVRKVVDYAQFLAKF